MASLYSSLKDLQESLPTDKLAWVKEQGGHPSFWSYLRYSLQLALEEKEIIFFAGLQWAVIIGAYLLCIEVFLWIPEAQTIGPIGEVSAESNMVFLVWVFSCVTLSALPIGVLTGAMAASHFLRHHGRESTVAACLSLAFQRVVRLWLFHAIDGFITVWQALRRLPSKNKKRPPTSVASELAYYAWKIASAAAVPTLLLADTSEEAMRASARFARDEIVRIAHLRAAYSFVCWVLAFVTGAAAFAYFKVVPTESLAIYEVFLGGAVPLGFSFAVLMIILRPIYVLSLCHLYSQHVAKLRAAAAAKAA